MAQPKTKLKIVFGAMTLGRPGVEQTRVHTLEGSAALLDVFQKHGHSEVDTARVYGEGSSEEYLGQLDWAARGIVMDTKLYPNGRGEAKTAKTAVTTAKTVKTYTHEPALLEEALLDSLRALKTESIDMWYLHAPDRAVPFEDTLREVDRLYRQGRFRRFGLSNYAAWEVAQIVETARRHGWKTPDAYQGVYNALHRAVEPELLPCLRHYGIALYAYNPLAGGLLTDRYERPAVAGVAGVAGTSGAGTSGVSPGSRFDPSRSQGTSYRQRYWNDAFFDALDVVRPLARSLSIPTAEAAQRWLVHHSQLDPAHGDAVIVGASSAAQLEENLADLEKGPLPQELVAAFDAAWQLARPTCRPYFH